MAKNNNNGVDGMLDLLYEMIDDAKAVPFSSDCRLDRNGALDLMDSIRNQFPRELSEAVKIVKSRDQIIADAQKEAARILEQAQAQAQHMVDESELVRRTRATAEEVARDAKAEADRIVTEANNEARATREDAEDKAESLKRAANEYCADALRRTEDAVSKAYEEIKQSHDHFRAIISATAPASGRRAAAYDAAENE